MLRKVWVQKHNMKTDYLLTLWFTGNKHYQMISIKNHSQKVEMGLGVFTSNLDNVLAQFGIEV